MKTKKSNILLNKRLWVALLTATLICVVFSFSALAENTIDISPTSQNRIIFLGDRSEGINEVYEIKNEASLVEADLALLRWNAMGNDADNSNDKIIGVFGENGEEKVIYYGYWNVYEQIYQRLLNAEDVITKSTADNITLDDVTSGTMIVKFTKGSRTSITAKLKNLSTVKGKLIILAEDAAELLTSEYSTYCRFSIESGGTLVIQGPRDKKITLSDKANQAAKRSQKSFIDVADGNLYLSNCVLQNYTFNGLYKSTICFPSSNTERHLYMANSTMQNVTALNTNNSTYGCETGGILCMVYGGDNSKADDSTLYINKCTFSQCNINSTGTVGGGAIRSYVADQCDLFVYNSTFSNNKCYYNGTYTSGGGAIYWKSADGEATLSGCTFKGNYAAKVGGAIYNTGKMTIKGCKFIENNKAGDSGGAIAVEPPNTSTSYNISPTSGSLELDSTTIIENNTATNRGGGIYFNAVASKIGTTEIEIFEMTLTINGAQIKNNTAQYGGGVAMWLNYGKNNYATGISIKENSNIANNTATVAGGAIWMNSADSCQCNGNIGVTMESGTMSQNYAPSGGAVYIGAGTSAKKMEFKMKGGTVSGNGVNANGETTVNGGAIYMTSGTCTISGGTIDTCKATANGGAIYMTSGKCTISGGTIENCQATANGGGVYLGGGTFALNHTLGTPATISNCTAGNNGGGVYLGAGTMTINGGKITKNTAQNGGGAYVNATITDHGIFVTGGEISENTATNGGGLAVNNGYFKMTGGVIDGNTAANYGGGIYVSATTNVDVDILSGTIQGNYAAVSGGALGVEGKADNVEFTITIGVNQQHPCSHDFDPGSDNKNYNCPIIQNNTALKTGGGIFITGSTNAKLNIYCLVESGNKAADGKLNDQNQPDTSKSTKSDFMMVRGGDVLLSTADTDGEGEDGGTKGSIEINGSIHVKAGKMTLDGSISNPLINGEITVDVADEKDFKDYRHSNPNADDKYFTIQYFENFYDPDTQKTSGQYTVILVKADNDGKATHTILPTLYVHDGWLIDGWWTNATADGDAKEFAVNTPYTIESNLRLWAKWLPVGYWVYFDTGTTDYCSGTMDRVRYDFIKGSTTYTLPANQFFYKGNVFQGWSVSNDNNPEYIDKETITTDLTKERSITLYACWSLCDHNTNVTFTYSGSGTDTLVRTCSCAACTQTATLIAENTVYDGQPHAARVNVIPNSTNGIQPESWDLPIVYTGTKFDGTGASNSDLLSPINAGNYTASITDGGETATVYFTIDKAQWTTLPVKPEYKSKETDPTAEAGKIIIINPDDTTGRTLLYKVVWHDENGENTSGIIDLASAMNQGFALTTNYTNYYVYVQYAEDSNHYASQWVRADSVLFYEGNVYIYIHCQEGIDYTTESLPTERGLIINITPQNGFYLYNTQVTDDNDQATIDTIQLRQRYRVNEIPNPQTGSVSFNINIEGAKKYVKIDPTITSSEEFGTVTGTEATITRDSAYTAYFEVKNYDAEVYTDPQLMFTAALPEKTTIILIDKSSATPTYWSYRAGGAISSIPLTEFVQMGTQNTCFAITSVNSNLQVVVDFSDCVYFIAGEQISTSLTASLVDGASGKGAPAFPVASRTTKLQAPTSAGLTVSGEGLTKNLTITRPSSTSKWNNRASALVVTPSSILPVDAVIAVSDGRGEARYNRTANGDYIIPLADFNSNILELTLVSNLFPKNETIYEFSVSLIYSDSLAAKAPINGATLLSQNANFKKAETAEPAIAILVAQQNTMIYPYGGQVPVIASADNLPENTILIFRLLNKDVEKKTYIDTGWKRQVSDDERTEVPLGALSGSCCIVLELREGNAQGDIILSTSYYFYVNEAPNESQ